MNRIAVGCALALITAATGCGSSPVAGTTKTGSVSSAKASASTSKVQVSAAPKASPWTYKTCDENVEARQPHTTCEFATNAFYEYWDSDGAATISVYSPVLKDYMDATCDLADGMVRCRTADEGLARFPQSAVDSYTVYLANAYIRGADVGPRGARGDRQKGGGGSYSPPTDYSSAAPDQSYDPPTYSPPSSGGGDIPYPGTGDRVMCSDGMYSNSGGIQGACSHHGGVAP